MRVTEKAHNLFNLSRQIRREEIEAAIASDPDEAGLV